MTSNLPPVRGGSGVVYDSLARHAGGLIGVLAPRRSYQDGLPLIGWREHDRQAPYRVIRLHLLRTVLWQGPADYVRRLRLLLADAVIRINLLATLLHWVVRDGVSAVCVGELVASGWVLGLLRLLPWVKRAVYVHGEEITTQGDYDPLLERRRRALLTCHHVIVVSNFTETVVADLMGAAGRGRITLIENGVDVSRFRPKPRRPDLVTRHGLEGTFVFVSVCRLLEKKGIDQAIRAFAQLVAEVPDSRYLIVGEGPYRGTLQAIAAECGVHEKVVFAGTVAEDELVDHYVLGDVFVMPNRRLVNGDTEGFGLVFLEANACGLPVIAGSDGGSTDAVRHGVNGLLVDGHSVGSIADAMRELRGDPDLRRRLRADGLAVAKAADWRHKAQAFLALLASGQ